MAKVYAVEATRDGSLVIPHFGTKFSIEYSEKSTGRLLKAPITASPQSGVFYTLFPEDDVDFQLIVNNEASRKRDFRFCLDLQKKLYAFVVTNYKAALDSVDTFGPKFHFVRQDGQEGRVLVGAAASRHGISHKDASVLVSRMEFKGMTFGTCDGPSRTDGECKVGSKKLKGEEIQVFVKTTRGKTIILDVAVGESVKNVKKMLEDREGIPAEDQRILYTKYQLTNRHCLGCYGISNGSTLIMYGGSIKGGQRHSSGSSVASEASGVELIDLGEEASDADEAELNGQALEIGDRGVICSGGRSSQIFGDCGHFIHEFVSVEPFVIEMHMASRFNLF